jgi:hypothetical protein
VEKLHEKAAETYNGRLNTLPPRLQPRPERAAPPIVPAEKNDTHVTKVLGPQDIFIESYREYRTDYTGERKACYFHTKTGFMGISGDDHDVLVSTTRRIANDRAYRDSLSEEFVYQRGIEWLQALANASTDTPPEFTDFLHIAALKAVRKTEIWMPVPVVQITRPFDIGWVTFRRITKDMMDELAARSNVSSSAAAEAAFDRQRSRLQSATAACVEVTAEPIRANEIATEQAEASVAILRLTCPAMMNAYAWAPIDPSFIDRMGASIILRVEDKQIIGQQNSLHERMLGQWVLRDADIDHDMRTLWGFGHNLLIAERNDFQDMLLRAVIHYSRSVLKADTAERLLYIVTALESIFIRDAKENIVQNLRERMAALAGPTKTERLKILDVVSRIYELRSAFVHRAVPVADMAQLQDFFLEAWSTISFILNNYDKWLTKVDFLRMVDEHKFSGPEFSTGGMKAV